MKHKNRIWFYQFMTIGFLLMLVTSCKKDDTVPAVTTSAISIITYTTARSGGDVTSDGGEFVAERGVCWGTSAAPTIAGSKTIDGLGTGAFISSITELTPGATYYVRAYATNSNGTAYGKEVSFTTTSAGLPTLITTAVTSISQNTATGGGFIALESGADVTACGVCWGTSAAPTITGNKTTDGTGTGAFTSSITGLIPGTSYYVRAYATNNIGTAYGNEVSFTTSPPAEPPTLTTTAVNPIGEFTATSGGNITLDGGADVTARGVCWSKTPDPTITNDKTTDGTGTGAFTSSITGLRPNTTYYVRAYATNYAGTAYGNELSFKTNPVPIPDRKGWWKFDNSSDLVKAEIGNALVLTGVMQSVNGPIAGNKAISIGVGSYLAMNHGIPANGGGNLVNEWSLQIDFSVPPEALGSWHGFFQIDPSSDGNLFIRSTNTIGIGAFGYSTKTISPNTWYRMILTVKNGEFWKLYLNGELWVDGSAVPEVDGSTALGSVLYLFGDDDGEDLTTICSEAGIWDVGLTAIQVAALGNAFE